jgi:hypothetical protein
MSVISRIKCANRYGLQRRPFPSIELKTKTASMYPRVKAASPPNNTAKESHKANPRGRALFSRREKIKFHTQERKSKAAREEPSDKRKEYALQRLLRVGNSDIDSRVGIAGLQSILAMAPAAS